MMQFLNSEIEGNKFELLIDTKIFNKEIIIKSAYSFLDKGYFYFSQNNDNNIILQFTPKEGILVTPESIIGDFSDELMSTLLRNNLEKENKDIREKIIGAAISNSLDVNNFVELDTSNNEEQIDFDKDIDDILREIEQDPDLKIDEDEIEKILKEIEDEAEEENKEKKEESISIDPEGVKKAKEQFNK